MPVAKRTIRSRRGHNRAGEGMTSVPTSSNDQRPATARRVAIATPCFHMERPRRAAWTKRLPKCSPAPASSYRSNAGGTGRRCSTSSGTERREPPPATDEYDAAIADYDAEVITECRNLNEVLLEFPNVHEAPELIAITTRMDDDRIARYQANTPGSADRRRRVARQDTCPRV